MMPTIATPTAKPSAIVGNAMGDAPQIPTIQASVNGTKSIAIPLSNG
jgi:hypothetical protein